jgi:beta-mannosidase
MKTVWSESKILDMGANCSVLSGITVPESGVTQWLKLAVINSSGETLAENFYWLNKQNDFTALNSLPEPKLVVKANALPNSKNHKYQVSVKNTGQSMAFMLNLKLVGKDSKQEILPAFWSDNYISLLPEESKTFEVEIMNDDLIEMPVLEYSTYGHNKKILEIK